MAFVKTQGLICFLSLVGCGSRLHVLDKGHVSVSGLQQAASMVSGDVGVFPEFAQSRQTITVRLSPSVLSKGRFISVINDSVDPPAALADKVPVPDAGQRADLPVGQLALSGDQSLNLSFAAGTAARAGLLSYGDNHLRIQMFTDLGLSYEGVGDVVLRDFESAGVLQAFFVGAESSDGDQNFKGWVANFVLPTTSPEGELRGEAPSFIQNGWYPIVNP